MYKVNQADLDDEGCNGEDGNVNLGIQAGVKPKEFPSAKPSSLVASDVNLLGSSGIML